ncbi:hypothetical protein, variant 3 [Phytophthora nicotianae INRA-310]|uniref:DRTGG domain-containing protein n=6 Tax=Phytophthora nicotianae TaxID=4792 RepID=W2PNY8_PHYN3|nr:hypothetical protein, variant 2 [Phytophthora nicotianae INRA-310]XP_008913056.1 hypothetical protein, variant 3 [Phytophthora nicotianae INRA-310]ETN01740.1 hypothetical protein, variant 2 [Phytophthora nicotianae INRA-310]ETN01741.1 hypothetical protein, variant 3 [Phytophthora nicotianae INRA-310]
MWKKGSASRPHHHLKRRSQSRRRRLLSLLLLWVLQSLYVVAMTNHLLVLSTGQHVGKTTLSLGLVKTLQAKFQGTNKLVAYCKPVGQQHVPVGDNLRVDKDAYLFKEHFGLIQHYKDMSPVIFPDGFTRDFIDGKVTSQQLMDSIRAAHRNLYDQSDFVICEGTGHTGVGSICELNNAQVAAELKIDAVCVALGGLGSSFDQLAMNREMLKQNNVRLRGVVLNKVNPKKMDMIQDYYSRALKRWDVPLVGCIPDLKDLSCPTMADYAKLLKSDLISGTYASTVDIPLSQEPTRACLQARMPVCVISVARD